MIIIRSSDIQPTETPGHNFTSGLATASRGATEVSVIRQRQLPGGFNPLHYHDREEIMVMGAGAMTITVADETVTLVTGDTLIVPAYALHQLKNTGSEPAEWLIIALRERRFFSAEGQEAAPPWAQ